MWNLEKWFRLTYFQGRNADIENKHVDTGWGGEGRTNGRLGLTYIYTLPCKK